MQPVSVPWAGVHRPRAGWEDPGRAELARVAALGGGTPGTPTGIRSCLLHSLKWGEGQGWQDHQSV